MKFNYKSYETFNTSTTDRPKNDCVETAVKSKMPFFEYMALRATIRERISALSNNKILEMSKVSSDAYTKRSVSSHTKLMYSVMVNLYGYAFVREMRALYILDDKKKIKHCLKAYQRFLAELDMNNKNIE